MIKNYILISCTFFVDNFAQALQLYKAEFFTWARRVALVIL